MLFLSSTSTEFHGKKDGFLPPQPRSNQLRSKKQNAIEKTAEEIEHENSQWNATVDQAAFIIFLIAFIVFNVIYWSYYSL